MIGAWLFYGLAASTVFVFRRTAPELARPYRCPGYPVLPALFLLLAAGVMVNSFVATPRTALLAAAVMLLGLPFYAYWSRGGGAVPARDHEALVGSLDIRKNRLTGRGSMFHQMLTPVGSSLALSCVVAALPVSVVVLLLGVFRRPAWQAACWA